MTGRRGVDAWFWERNQHHLEVAFVLAILAVNSLAIAGPTVAVGSLFLDLRVGEGILWMLSVVVTGLLGTSAAFVAWRRQFAPMRRWSAGDRTEPEALLRVLLRLPQMLFLLLMTFVLGSQALTGFPFVLWMARPSAEGAVALGLAYVLVTSAIGILTAGTTQLLIRTAVEELGRMVDSEAPVLSRWWTLRWRLVMTIAIFCGLAGVVTAAVVLGTSASENDYLVAVVGGTVWGAYFGCLASVALVGPMLAPLDAVIAGTLRVRRGDLTEPVPVLLADEFGDLAIAFNEMQSGLQQRAALQEAFGSYVDPSLAQRLVDSGSAVFEGEGRMVTVLFADVRGFTSYADGVDPATAVALLNRLFDVMVPVLHEHGGHANHYLGDGLLAVFGAPQELERHAEAALASAVEIQRKVRSEFAGDLRLGIGINTGPVIAGTVGGGGRHEFTVIGDTVNVAARVEQLTKETGDAILLTEATRLSLSPPRPRTAKRGEFEVRGKAAKLTLHAINPFPRSSR